MTAGRGRGAALQVGAQRTASVTAAESGFRAQAGGVRPQLRALELCGLERLRKLPEYLSTLTALRALDVSHNRSLDPAAVATLTGLQSLSMKVRVRVRVLRF